MTDSSSNPWDALSDEARQTIRSSLEHARRGEQIDAASLAEAQRTLPKSVQDLLRDLLDDRDLSIGVDDLWDLIADESDLAHDTPTGVRPTQAPTATASGTPDAATAEPARDVLDRLLQRRNPFERYELLEQIGRGGMGTVWRVWDRDLRRHCAMKFLDRAELDDPSVLHRLVRFLEEAQVSGQLEHPGIVPIHEIGLDEQRRIYFVMRLVRGRDLSRILFFVRAGSAQWSITRALGVLQRVCETMAYAHARDVVHRDLKPSNIMVGRFGVTYVMDWGIARILAADAPDESADVRPVGVDPSVWTDRQEERRRHQTPLATQHGDVLGTPAYMAPEQARGELDLVGPLSDVYSCGAILYQLITGRVPYVKPGERVSHFDILDRVLAGPPAPVEKHARSQPAELHAICGKAMARDPAQRFASMADMAEDIRRYLEGHVVRAHRTGAWVEFRKWVNRNRGVAAALLALLLVLALSGFGVGVAERRRSTAAVRNLHERLAPNLVASADDLWPVHPDTSPELRAWLDEAHTLVTHLPAYERELSELRERALPYSEQDAQADIDPQLLQKIQFHTWFEQSLKGTREKYADRTVDTAIRDYELEFCAEELESLGARLGVRRTWRFTDEAVQRRHDRLAALVQHMHELNEPERGLISRLTARLEAADSLGAHSVERHRDQWEEAIASIRDEIACPAYTGLEIEPQIGLVPLWRDSQSGLWEFWHVLSGERPERDENGTVSIGPETGIVLVLVPGGSFMRGAQIDKPDVPNFDPNAKKSEGPPTKVTLDPYFLSKYEVTQGQWYRLTGRLSSENRPGLKTPGDSTPISRTHPVEQISWQDCADTLARWSLGIPTEAQWERAARAGSRTPYWCGTDPTCIFGAANFKDQATAGDSTIERTEFLPDFDDGYRNHAPVDRYSPNPFGFFNILGNVHEWTLDWYIPRGFAFRTEPATGERVPQFSNAITYRGGSFESPLIDLRVTRVHKTIKAARNEDIGVRPVRALEPATPR